MVSPGLRFQVLQRDRFTCQYCGRAAPDVVLEVDHRWPVSRGGRDTPENLATACQDCNRGKWAHALEEAAPPISILARKEGLQAAEARLLRAHAHSLAHLVSEWTLMSGESLGPSLRDEVALSNLIVTHEMLPVWRACKLSALHHGYDEAHDCLRTADEDVCPEGGHGRPRISEIDQTLRRWNRESYVRV